MATFIEPVGPQNIPLPVALSGGAGQPLAPPTAAQAQQTAIAFLSNLTPAAAGFQAARRGLPVAASVFRAIVARRRRQIGLFEAAELRRALERNALEAFLRARRGG